MSTYILHSTVLVFKGTEGRSNLAQKKRNTKHTVRVPLTLPLPESVMEAFMVVLTLESVDEILWCDHSNETSSAVLSHGTICFAGFEKMKFRIFS